MAQAKTYDMTVYPMTMAVRSETDGARAYVVQLPYCPCADFTNRKGRMVRIDGGPVITICKHISEAIERVGGWHRQESPEVHENLVNKQLSEILTGVGLSAGVVSMIIKDAYERGTSEFPAGVAGAKVAGYVTFDRVRGRYGVTLLG